MNQEDISLSLETKAGLPGLLVTIGERYATASTEDIDTVITESLGMMGQFVQADRVYVFDYDFDRNETSNTYEWCAQGIEPELDNLQRVPIDEIAIWVDNHRRGKAVYVAQVTELPEGHALREILEPQGIQSLLALPLMSNGELQGFVGFDAVRHPHTYSDEDILLLSVFGQMLINIKTRVAAIATLLSAKEQAERTARAKDAFLNTMSHELRTPMNAILGFAELLEAQNTDPVSGNYVQPILQAGQRLSHMIDDILAYSELDAGGQALYFKAVDLDGLIDELNWEYQVRVKERHLTLTMPTQLQERLMLDVEKLRKVLDHLLANAVKFTERGEITLGVTLSSAENDQVSMTFSVTDTGIGIDPRDQERIFTPFSQADGTMNRQHSGAGLSLALCHRLVQAMGGMLKVESRPGQGSRFWFSLLVDRAV